MKHLSILAASTAALLSAPALANEATEAVDGAQEVVITASGVEQDIATTGQAITVIDRDTIETRQTVALVDLLATTPGVTYSRNGGIGSVTTLRIRGAEGDHTLTLIDGVRVNDPSAPGGAFDFANLLSASIDRVEVLRGPNSVPWGSQAIGGVVNIITQRATNGFNARANVEYGSMDTLFASGGVSGGNDRVTASLSGGYLRSDGVSAYANGAEADGYRQYGASGRVEVALTPDLHLDLRGYWSDSRSDLDGFPAPSYSFADTAEYSTSQELYAYAGLRADIGGVKNRIAFQIADINRDNYDADLGPTPQFLSRGRSERFTYQGDVQIIDPIRLVVGAEHETTRLFDGSSNFHRNTSSLWAQAIVTPVQSVTLNAGVRYDDDQAFGGHTTFGANAAIAVTDTTTLRASYAEGFKAPTLYQLYAPWYGTPGLNPETARSFDAGIEQAFLGGKGRASATYFNRKTRNQIDFDMVSYTYNNIAKTVADGVELTLLLKPVDALTVSTSFSYINSENRSDGFIGNQLARRPQEVVSVSADYRLPFGLSLGATVLTVGDSYDNAANTVALDGYSIANIRAEMPVTPRLSIYGRVDNLFDAGYQTVANYGSIGRAIYGGIRVKLN